MSKPSNKTVGVVGGRNFTDYASMVRLLDIMDIRKIVSGGARGADGLAYKYAVGRGINFVCYPPLKFDIDEFGFGVACKLRNKRIIAAIDELTAFPDKNSKGTWHTVNLAKKISMTVTVIGP